MHRRFQYLVAIRGDRDRQLIVAGVVLTVICAALYINLTIVLSRRSSRQSQASIENTTGNATTPTPLLLTTTAMGSTPLLLSTTTLNSPEQYTNYTVPWPPVYQNSSGYVLGGFLYLNYQQQCTVNGHVSHVYLRLFGTWKGTAPLYLFVILLDAHAMGIVHQYTVPSHGNTTEWQTITIPRDALPIPRGYFLAVGMQDRNSTNQIYIVEEMVSMRAQIVGADNNNISSQVNAPYGVALAYTVAHSAVARPKKPRPGR